MNNYTKPKPSYPLYLKLLAALVTVGLLGLGIVSFHTFSQVHGPFVAGIYAAIIEVGAALDAIGLAGGINKRSWWLVPAVILTIAGSGWYNYAAVAASGATWGIKDPLQLEIVAHAIAWLPLGSLSFMALGLGYKISDHETAVNAWEVERQAWQDAQVQQAERARLDTQRITIEAQERVQLAQIQAEADARARADRAEARRIARLERAAAQPAPVTAQPAVLIAQPAQRSTYEDFSLAQLARNGAGPMDYKQVMKHFNVSRRTAYTWLERLEKEHAQPVEMLVN